MSHALIFLCLLNITLIGNPTSITWNSSNTDIVTVGHKYDICLLWMSGLFSTIRCATNKTSCTKFWYQVSIARSLCPVVPTKEQCGFINYLISLVPAQQTYWERKLCLAHSHKWCHIHIHFKLPQEIWYTVKCLTETQSEDKSHSIFVLLFTLHTRLIPLWALRQHS